jgi:hypothetical protein
MLYALHYAITRRVLRLSGISSDTEAEVLVLRHEFAVLRRQIKREGCIYSDPRHDQQVSFRPFGLPRTRGRAQETSPRPGRAATPRPSGQLLTSPLPADHPTI